MAAKSNKISNSDQRIQIPSEMQDKYENSAFTDRNKKQSEQAAAKESEMSQSGQKYKKLPKVETWTEEEDSRLLSYVKDIGNDDNAWKEIGKSMRNRRPNQLKARYWILAGDEKKCQYWTMEEDKLLTTIFAIYGPRWSRYIDKFPGRSIDAIKCHWRTLLRRGKSAPPPKKEMEEIAERCLTPQRAAPKSSAANDAQSAQAYNSFWAMPDSLTDSVQQGAEDDAFEKGVFEELNHFHSQSSSQEFETPTELPQFGVVPIDVNAGAAEPARKRRCSREYPDNSLFGNLSLSFDSTLAATTHSTSFSMQAEGTNLVPSESSAFSSFASVATKSTDTVDDELLERFLNAMANEVEEVGEDEEIATESSLQSKEVPKDAPTPPSLQMPNTAMEPSFDCMSPIEYGKTSDEQVSSDCMETFSEDEVTKQTMWMEELMHGTNPNPPVAEQAAARQPTEGGVVLVPCCWFVDRPLEPPIPAHPSHPLLNANVSRASAHRRQSDATVLAMAHLALMRNRPQQV